MPNFVAMLRGINVGTSTRVSMADLRALFEELGAKDVQTYVQSGNVVFSSKRKPAQLQRAIQDRIEEDLGLNVTVLVRTEPELGRVVAGNPFLKNKADPKALHVTFLAAKPKAKNIAGLSADAGAPDEFRIQGREIYLHTPGGYGRTKLNNAFFEKKLGVAATTRNWRTVTTLADLAS